MKKVESRKSQVFRGLLVLLVSCLLGVPASMADEGIQGGGGEGRFSRFLGKLQNPFSGLPGIFSELSPADVGHKPRVRPHFAFTQGFTSNARLGVPSKADGAWQARIAPGISVSIPSGKLYTEADYTYGFATTQGVRTHDNINTHNVSVLAHYDLSPDTAFGLGNNLQLSEIPSGGGGTFILETATAQASHRLGPKLTSVLSDTFQYFRDQSKLISRNQNDFVDNGVGAGMTYDVTSDLSAGPSFTWNVRNFTHQGDLKDYWQISPNLNASYRLGPKTTVGGNFGWALRRFKKKGINTSSRTESELVYGASVSHLLGRKLIWSVSYAKSLQDTFDTSFVFKDSALATELDNLDRDFRVIKSHRLGSIVTYNFTERNSAGVWGDFSFLDGGKKDNVATDLNRGASRKNREKSMEVGVKYTYRLNRYISFDVLYAFGRRFSTDSPSVNNNRNDYTFHKVTGGLNIAL